MGAVACGHKRADSGAFQQPGALACGGALLVAAVVGGVDGELGDISAACLPQSEDVVEVDHIQEEGTGWQRWGQDPAGDEAAVRVA